jgi:lactoylglutathione lyase
MRIEHVAIWVKDLELMRKFYIKYFNAKSNGKYVNSKKGFSSYFLSFESGARLEIMNKENIVSSILGEYLGYTHLAFSVGNRVKVDEITERLRKDGYKILDEARVTGDGYYESVVVDPENNKIEITE